DQLGTGRIYLSQLVQGVVEVEQLVRRFRQGDVDVFEAQSPPAAAALEPAPVAGAVDEDAAHGLGGGSEEMPAAVPVPFLVVPDQAQVGLVNQGGGLERLSRLLVGQLLGGELAQLVVDQRQELLCGRGVALLDGGQDAGDFTHVGSLPRGNRLVSLGGQSKQS